MAIRVLIIIAIVLVGAAFVVPSNPYTDKITTPAIKGIKKVYSYFDDKVGLPDVDLPVETTTVHKWQDKDGNWHFSNTEAPKGVTSETKTYTDDTNVMPTPKPKE